MGTRKSTTGAQHSFSNIPSAEIQRSQFDRSCGLKTTFDSGLLIPVFVDEALPGDTMNMRMSTFGRLATPLHPIMDNLYMDFHFFSVPLRLIWDNFQKFMGEQTDPGDSTDFLVPQLVTPAAPGGVNGELSDYLGIPTEVPDLSHSALFHRAYNLIYNEWFRDENLQDSLVVDRDDGPDTHADYSLVRRGKRKDYFTACLPFPQKGDSVVLPLGTTAPLLFSGVISVAGTGDGIPQWDTIGSSNEFALEATTTTNPTTWNPNPTGFSGSEDARWVSTKLKVDVGDLNTGVADLTNATAATINSIRQAFQIQKLYERDARGGTRYTEILRSHFGVVSPDQRLQRPEYLGGGTSAVGVTSVPQTSETNTTAQGNLAGYGTSAQSGIGFSKSFVEHSVIIGLVSVRADLNYQQGLPRMFSRSTRWDFFWPALAHLGEQAVLNKEIFAQGSVASATDILAFGYQERFAEYRYKPSQITGQMRSSFTTSLDTWHLAQDFAALPVLDATFIEENPPVSRIVAVTTEPEFLLDAFFSYKCARPMPTYGVPGLIDHF